MRFRVLCLTLLWSVPGIVACGGNGDEDLTKPDATISSFPDAMPDDGGGTDGPVDLPDAGDGGGELCEGCIADGDPCELDLNCRVGSVCNDPQSPYHDPFEPDGVCVRVACTSDAECTAPRVCSAEGVCAAPFCRGDEECAAGLDCLGGQCTAPIDPRNAAACVVTTPNQVILEGAQVRLRGLVYNVNNAVVPGVVLEWTSSDPAIVAVSSTTAIGAAEGTAVLSARVAGNPSVTCSGVTIRVHQAVSGLGGRVLVYAQDTGLPISSATVTVELAEVAPANGLTDTNGQHLWKKSGSITAITARAANYGAVSVLLPETRDLVLWLPRIQTPSFRGGLRGSVAFPGQLRDLRIGLAGRARNEDLLDFRLEPTNPEIVTTRIDAPEIGFNDESRLMDGAVVLALGRSELTEDATEVESLRCQGNMPPQDALGCYLVRVPAGPTAAYAFGGNLRLAQVTPVFTELSALLGNPTETNIVPLYSALSQLMPSLTHAFSAHHVVEQFPAVPKEPESGADCTDPNINRETACRGDYARFSNVALEALASVEQHSVISVPRLPMHDTACATTQYLAAYAQATGRGLIPLGVRSEPDVASDSEAPDCQVDGVIEPFGENSPELRDGQMALSAAARHSGLEDEQLYLSMVAYDERALDPDARRSVIFYPVPSISELVDVSNLAYAPLPAAELQRSTRTLQLTEPRVAQEATGVRLTVAHGDARWVIYGPANSTELVLPAVLGKMLDGTETSELEAYRGRGTYDAMFSLSSGNWQEITLREVESFSSETCAPGPLTRCTVR